MQPHSFWIRSGKKKSSTICKAYDPYSDAEIPFRTASDALLARLRLEEGLSISTVNLFLDILRDRHFNTEDISFQSAAGIDKFVAEHKLTQQYIGEVNGRADVPFPVLDRILYFISCDRDLQDEPTNRQIPITNIMMGFREDVFRSMARVQKSWLGPSRVYLSRRIIARSPSDIVRLLRGPIPSRHTQEFILLVGEVWGSNFRPQSEVGFYLRPGDVEVDLVNLFDRMPRLRSLTIKESGLQENVILKAVSHLQNLQTLKWHRTAGHPTCDFQYLALALLSLSRLFELEVCGWTFHNSSSTVVDTIPPLPPQLQNLHICMSPGEMQVARVGWLLQSLSKTGQPTLTLDLTVIGTLVVQDILQNFPLAKESLAELHTLHLINKGGFVETNLIQSRIFLQACSKLRHLHVQSQIAPITEFVDVLPSTLEELWFSWFDMWMSPWNLIEAHMPNLLRGPRLPFVKRVVIHNYDVPFQQALIDANGLPISHPCPETQKACDERSIVLDLSTKPPSWNFNFWDLYGWTCVMVMHWKRQVERLCGYGHIS